VELPDRASALEQQLALGKEHFQRERLVQDGHAESFYLLVEVGAARVAGDEDEAAGQLGAVVAHPAVRVAAANVTLTFVDNWPKRIGLGRETI